MVVEYTGMFGGHARRTHTHASVPSEFAASVVAVAFQKFVRQSSFKFVVRCLLPQCYTAHGLIVYGMEPVVNLHDCWKVVTLVPST